MRMFSRHFHRHPLIPDENGVCQNSESIRRKCVSEMYDLCRENDWVRVWNYMYLNWYRPGQWELWARSANDSEIPVLKTTMIIESHWRRIKRDYLHD